ncbi:MAG: AAA family ATPase, partial [Eggerthellaceae bacterium]|nr:AAA family ATPase [Eggerthellaceae bacterium]
MPDPDFNFKLKIFISSTFDEDLMKQTRGAFRNEINAQLNNIVGLLGGNAYVFDLQLGVPTGTPALETLRICFEKIGQSDLFVFILGEKHGTQNARMFLLGHESPGEAKLRPQDLPFAETIQKGIDEGLFLIELEVLEAEKNPRLAGRRIFFFDRKLSNVPDEGISPTQEVMQRIKAARPSEDTLLDFTDAEDIKQAFLAYFKALFSDRAASLSSDEKNRNLHYAGALRYNVENTAGLALLDEYLASESQRPLALFGPSGSGKSSLLADWLKDKPKAISYHVGAVGSTLSEMLLELYKKQGGRPEDERKQGSLQELMEQFYPFLSKLAEGGPQLIVLDGLEQLSPEGFGGDNYAWIPQRLPKGIKLVFTTTDELSSYNFDLREMPQVDLGEVLKSILEHEGKELEFSTIEEAMDEATFSTSRLPVLALLMYNDIVEEFDYRSIHKNLASYLNSVTDPETLFQNYLQRLEARFGKALVSKALALIWCAKFGLSQEDLQQILAREDTGEGEDAPAPEKLDEFFYMVYHEFCRDGKNRLSFLHSHLVAAVGLRYCSDEAYVYSLRGEIVDYLEAKRSKPQAGSVDISSEVAYQLYRMQDGAAMQRLLAEIDVAAFLYAQDAIAFFKYVSLVKSRDELHRAWEDFGYSDERMDFLAAFFRDMKDYSLTLGYLKIRMKQARSPLSRLELAALHFRIADALHNLYSPEAKEWYQKTLRAAKKSPDKSPRL